jgi:carbonic anhydrase
MKKLRHLFDANARWAAETIADDPEFFSGLAALQTPEYLWIGCSDSRVPANQITGLKPGEVFVHRNVANVVVHTDLNCLSVVQYAIEVLHVKHIMVVGHYGCGGVRAALHGPSLGLIDNWLRHIQDVRDRHEHILRGVPGEAAQFDALCELNVIEQVRNVARTTLVGDAWRRGQDLTLHGWVYGLDNGHLHDVDVTIDGAADTEVVVQAAAMAVGRRYGGG